MTVYTHCAKGGHEKEHNQYYVCGDHEGTPEYYTHCARCGDLVIPETGEAVRIWLHEEHLAKAS
jgi:hypothetical protein